MHREMSKYANAVETASVEEYIIGLFHRYVVLGHVRRGIPENAGCWVGSRHGKGKKHPQQNQRHKREPARTEQEASNPRTGKTKDGQPGQEDTNGSPPGQSRRPATREQEGPKTDSQGRTRGQKHFSTLRVPVLGSVPFTS